MEMDSDLEVAKKKKVSMHNHKCSVTFNSSNELNSYMYKSSKCWQMINVKLYIYWCLISASNRIMVS